MPIVREQFAEIAPLLCGSAHMSTERCVHVRRLRYTASPRLAPRNPVEVVAELLREADRSAA